MDIDVLDLDGRRYHTVKATVVVSEAVGQACSAILDRWPSAFSVEPTWIQEHWSVPSVLVRMDFTLVGDVVFQPAGSGSVTIHDGWQLRVYEVDDRPSGVGMTTCISSAFRERLQRLRATWIAEVQPHGAPCAVQESNAQARHYADELWIDVLDRAAAQRENRLILWRGDPGADVYDSLASRTFSTWKTHNDKTYGVRLGWWQWTDPNEFGADNDAIWQESFALKPQFGWGGRDLQLWVPHGSPYKGLGGEYTKTSIRKLIARKGTMFRQAFLPPMVCPFACDYFMILRVYWGYDPRQGRYVQLGGFWNARRRQLKVFAADDAIYGPIEVEICA